MVTGRIYHLALAADWEADPAAAYAMSTIGVSLAEQGFVHCSFAHQLAATARRYYRGQRDVVLLEIDPTRLASPLEVEEAADGDRFPHVYGPINRDAVVRVTPVPMGEDGTPDVTGMTDRTGDAGGGA
jgi:glutathione S-transferase